MVSERTLKRWRKEALIESYIHQEAENEVFSTDRKTWYELHNRIIRLTQELLDQHLLRK